MECRVETKDGENPIILLCPHSPEEDFTDLIAETISEKLEAYTIVNKGWERSENVDFLHDKANCNDLNQLLTDDVARDEFLIPLIQAVSQIRSQHFINVYIFIIHGFEVPAPKDPGQRLSKPDIVLGTGLPDRPSCDLWRRDALAFYLTVRGLEVYEGKPCGRFAGWARNNLNQFFRRKTDLWQKDQSVQSFQVEIEHAWRKSAATTRVVSEALWKSIEELVNLGDEKTDNKLELKQW